MGGGEGGEERGVSEDGFELGGAVGGDVLVGLGIWFWLGWREGGAYVLSRRT